jgi:hypothetical protein
VAITSWLTFERLGMYLFMAGIVLPAHERKK